MCVKEWKGRVPELNVVKMMDQSGILRIKFDLIGTSSSWSEQIFFLASGTGLCSVSTLTSSSLLLLLLLMLKTPMIMCVRIRIQLWICVVEASIDGLWSWFDCVDAGFESSSLSFFLDSKQFVLEVLLAWVVVYGVKQITVRGWWLRRRWNEFGRILCYGLWENCDGWWWWWLLEVRGDDEDFGYGGLWWLKIEDGLGWLWWLKVVEASCYGWRWVS
jgi:hypothetical protein